MDVHEELRRPVLENRNGKFDSLSRGNHEQNDPPPAVETQFPMRLADFDFREFPPKPAR